MKFFLKQGVGKMTEYQMSKLSFCWDAYLTVIDVNLTESACETWRADTLEGSNIINASCSILAWN
jgi:hypothetical protein